MSAIDYQAVRARISMADVLDWIDFSPTVTRGAQLRGSCPLPDCPSRSHRCFSVHLERHIFQCFACHSSGTQLDLWAAVHQLSIAHAVIDLCHQARIKVPRIPGRN